MYQYIIYKTRWYPVSLFQIPRLVPLILVMTTSRQQTQWGDDKNRDQEDGGDFNLRPRCDTLGFYRSEHRGKTWKNTRKNTKIWGCAQEPVHMPCTPYLRKNNTGASWNKGPDNLRYCGPFILQAGNQHVLGHFEKHRQVTCITCIYSCFTFH